MRLKSRIVWPFFQKETNVPAQHVLRVPCLPDSPAVVSFFSMLMQSTSGAISGIFRIVLSSLSAVAVETAFVLSLTRMYFIIAANPIHSPLTSIHAVQMVTDFLSPGSTHLMKYPWPSSEFTTTLCVYQNKCVSTSILFLIWCLSFMPLHGFLITYE